MPAGFAFRTSRSTLYQADLAFSTAHLPGLGCFYLPPSAADSLCGTGTYTTPSPPAYVHLDWTPPEDDAYLTCILRTATRNSQPCLFSELIFYLKLTLPPYSASGASRHLTLTIQCFATSSWLRLFLRPFLSWACLPYLLCPCIPPRHAYRGLLFLQYYASFCISSLFLWTGLHCISRAALSFLSMHVCVLNSLSVSACLAGTITGDSVYHLHHFFSRSSAF